MCDTRIKVRFNVDFLIWGASTLPSLTGPVSRLIPKPTPKSGSLSNLFTIKITPRWPGFNKMAEMVVNCKFIDGSNPFIKICLGFYNSFVLNRRFIYNNHSRKPAGLIPKNFRRVLTYLKHA